MKLRNIHVYCIEKNEHFPCHCPVVPVLDVSTFENSVDPDPLFSEDTETSELGSRLFLKKQMVPLTVSAWKTGMNIIIYQDKFNH